MNFNLIVVGQAKILKLNDLEEHRLFSYENAELYKKKTESRNNRKCQKKS